MDVPRQDKDFVFLKWFLSISTIMVVGFGAFLFNLGINNQRHISEILVEIKNIRVIDVALQQEVSRLVQRFDQLSTDPVYGWGQRWSRSEAERENTRMEKKVDRLDEALGDCNDQIADLRVPLSKIEAEHEAMRNTLDGHVNLPAHIDAGNMLILLQTKMESILQKIEDQATQPMHTHEPLNPLKKEPLDR